MTLLFWLITGLMILIALLIVIPPLWRNQESTDIEDLDQRNISIASARLAELKANKESGGISAAQYEEQVAELELALGDDLELSKPSEQAQGGQGRWLVFVVIAFVPLLSGFLYWKLGNYPAIGRINEPGVAGTTTPSPEEVNNMVAKLAEKLKNEPNNLEGWVMLGRSYKVLERYPDAVKAFARAEQLAGEKAEVILPYAEALALSQNGSWQGKPTELVMKVLTLEPENVNGLWLAAMLNAQGGDKQTAITYLRKLETLLPEGSSDKQQIRHIIENTEKITNNLAQENPSDASGAAKNISVDIQVSLATELRSGITPDDTVFIYAQALSGPKMPLAIVRKKAHELPLSIRLTDAESMLPTMKLSSFQVVKLLARLSKSGNPMPQPGDLIGTVEHAKLDQQTEYRIVIKEKMEVP